MVRMDLDGVALPERVGRYEIVLPIGRGRRALVVLARATGLGGFDRFVALKLAAEGVRGDAGYASALVDDAKRIANLRHTDVVPVYDVGEDEPHGVFVVTEYVPGDSLAGLRRLAREKGEPLPKAIELRILVDALAGLHAAHEHADDGGKPLAIVHGGLSPRSVLVGTDGIARVADFGVAGGAGVEAKDAYVSPEQARGEAADRRSDVWSAGVIAWEVLTGEEARTWLDEPPRTNVSVDLDAAVAAALRIDREPRTASAAAFARELAAAARDAGMLAETEEVAALVNRLVGPELAKRRERLAQARPAAGASEVRTIIGMAAPPPPSHEKLPPLPDVPPAPVAVPDAPLTFLALKVDLGGAADRASETVLGASAQAAVAAEDDPAVYRSPVVPAAPLWKQKKVVIAAAAGAALLVVVLVLALRGKGTDAAAGASASATLASASAGAPAIDLDARASRTLHITADGPIAKVMIGERVIDVVAANTVDVELLEPERGKSLRVVVTGTDGRVATATADPGVRGLDVTLDPNALPPPPPPPKSSAVQAQAPAPARHAPAAPREKRTWPKRGPRK